MYTTYIEYRSQVQAAANQDADVVQAVHHRRHGTYVHMLLGTRYSSYMSYTYIIHVLVVRPCIYQITWIEHAVPTVVVVIITITTPITNDNDNNNKF